MGLWWSFAQPDSLRTILRPGLVVLNRSFPFPTPLSLRTCHQVYTIITHISYSRQQSPCNLDPACPSETASAKLDSLGVMKSSEGFSALTSLQNATLLTIHYPENPSRLGLP